MQSRRGGMTFLFVSQYISRFSSDGWIVSRVLWKKKFHRRHDRFSRRENCIVRWFNKLFIPASLARSSEWCKCGNVLQIRKKISSVPIFSMKIMNLYTLHMIIHLELFLSHQKITRWWQTRGNLRNF